MCTIAAASIVMGGAQMGAGIMQANAQHAAAQRAAQRRNQIAIQNYNNEIRVAELESGTTIDTSSLDLGTDTSLGGSDTSIVGICFTSRL